MVIKNTSLEEAEMLRDDRPVPDTSRAFVTVCDDLVVFTDTEAEGVKIDDELS